MLHAETWYWLGDFARAREEATRVFEYREDSLRHSRAVHYGNDAAAGGMIYLAMALWQLGYPDQALNLVGEALELARALAHPFTVAFALAFAGIIRQLRGETLLALDYARDLVRHSERHGFAMYSAMAAVQEAHLRTLLGSEGEPVQQLAESIAGWRALGERMWLTGWLANLGEAFGRVGSMDEGLGFLDEGLRLVERTGERCYEAELCRLRGELLLKKGENEAQAEVSFRQSLRVARCQGSRAWELRSATSLGRLWRAQGRADEARGLVQGVYAWFTEGFDTADLQGAKALLDSLG
jgi:tetratricopeptide (TPR) repeat protein